MGYWLHMGGEWRGGPHGRDSARGGAVSRVKSQPFTFPVFFFSLASRAVLHTPSPFLNIPCASFSTCFCLAPPCGDSLGGGWATRLPCARLGEGAQLFVAGAAMEGTPPAAVPGAAATPPHLCIGLFVTAAPAAPGASPPRRFLFPVPAADGPRCAPCPLPRAWCLLFPWPAGGGRPLSP